MRDRARSFALATAIFGVIVGGVALAHGPSLINPGPAPATGNWGGGQTFRGFFSAPEPETPRVRYEEPEQHHAKPKRSTGGGGGAYAAFGYGKPVCVRLCDGSFFPTTSVAAGEAACAAQCPDAPVALYTMPTDRIEDAVSSDGKRYSALPVASRFETSFENTCTCHRNPTVATRTKEILADTTLRKGDVVMTATGFRVYEGDGYGPTGPKDFLTLSQAKVSKEERATLAAMERASSGSAPTSTAPSVVAARPKGNVTVDNGTP